MKKRILGLDLFRFLVALGIMAYHYFFIGVLQGYYSTKVFHGLAFWGEFGVDIFFIISGFVILLSAEHYKNCWSFLKSRAKRIYPAFVLCSILLIFTGYLMPNTNIKDLLFRWMNSLTFMSDLWKVAPLSGVYWTLMVEVKFYILTALIIKTKLWEKYKYLLLIMWCLLSLVNSFALNNSIINMIFILKYTGHFVFGIVLYMFNKGERNKWMILLSVVSIWLIYRNMISYTDWIRELFPGLIYTNFDILFGLLIIISIIYITSNVYKTILPKTTIVRLGAWSFTLYLTHADFGYFIRTQYYFRLIRIIPFKINEHIVMIVIIIASLIVSYVLLLLSEKISTFLKVYFKLVRTSNDISTEKSK